MDILGKLENFCEEGLSISETEQLIRRYDEQIDGFVIYGCGPVGNYLGAEVLPDIGVKVLGYLDDFRDCGWWNGIKLLSLAEIKASYRKVCIIITSQHRRSIDDLKTRIQYELEDIGDVLEKDIFLYVSHNISMDKDRSFMGNVFGKMDLVVTNCCTLRCKGCSELIPYVTNKEHFDIQDVKKDISRINELVDYISVLEIMGGEPLLYPDLPELIDYISSLSNIYMIMIDTNGTVFPRKETLEAISRNHVIVHITDYGDVSTQKDTLLNACRKKEIYCTMYQVDKWDDFGELKEYTSIEDNAKFESCFAVNDCSNVYQGRWHICPRDTKLADLGFTSLCEGEFIDLHSEIPVGKKRQKMHELLNRKEAIAACRFCQGTDGKIQGGVQMKDVKEDI